MTPEALCGCGCGNPLGPHPAHGYRAACAARWRRQGKPEGGPRPPLSQAEVAALGRAEKDAKLRLQCAEDEPYQPDETDLAWARELWLRRRDEPDNRARRAGKFAAALVRCVGASDAEGIRLLLAKVTDWHALAVVLAECADPVRTAVTTRQPVGPLLASASRSAPSGDDGERGTGQPATVDEGAAVEAA